ncbi:pyridoxal-dependent decarboxylase [Flammeovirga sp. SJP92]|uniref:pyridoxal phosphate-dependent decarboxylase family protein n=1 Tax=Flammeovirga sp. SJP92 TaxID=1775430 RepID=UPI000789305B|nr:pyridoxal-dependent decarboxylase [Flammeovirga sp. SJP92]KXX67070.1 amino acid decarboxylase [Flammeovirga sp. SJP92]
MNEQLKNDLGNLEDLLEKVKLQGLDYLNTIKDRKTSTTPSISFQSQLQEIGLGGIDTLKLFNERFENVIVGSAGPRYLGYVVGGVTPAAIIGDWLATVYDQNPQTATAQGDVSIVIEKETIKLLLELFNLPNSFQGGFVTGATMSNFTCLAVARQWIGAQLGKDFAKDGISEKIEILSAVPHSSAIKSLSMLGIGRNNVEIIEVDGENREAINIQHLEQKIIALNGKPFILISSAGTVNTADFDDFKAIAQLKEKYNFWWHIDGAFGAFAACSPHTNHLVEDWEKADSITIDCHKWLNVPYDCAFFMVKKEHQLLQLETFKNSNAPYLGEPSDDFNFLNFLPENSRRLRALPAWFSLTAYGRKGYQDIVDNSVKMANILSEFITSSQHFKLLAPTRLNNVCFTLSNTNDAGEVMRFLTTLNNTGKVFMTPTVFNGLQGIRASFVNWRTDLSDLEIIIREMEKVALSEKSE